MFLFGILCVASLGVASRITVTIAASDDAHGVFQFSPEYLSVNGTEPEDGRSSVVLQVSAIRSLEKVRLKEIDVFLCLHQQSNMLILCLACSYVLFMVSFCSHPGGSILWGSVQCNFVLGD